MTTEMPNSDHLTVFKATTEGLAVITVIVFNTDERSSCLRVSRLNGKLHDVDGIPAYIEGNTTHYSRTGRVASMKDGKTVSETNDINRVDELWADLVAAASEEANAAPRVNAANPGSQEYWTDRKEAFALIAEIERQDDLTLHAAIQAVRSNPTAMQILTAQGRLDVLEPKIDSFEVHEIGDDLGYESVTVRWTDEGVLRIRERSVSDEEGSSLRRVVTLNGRKHDHGGESAVAVRKSHYIPEEKHLDEDYVESWFHGIFVDRDHDYAALRARLSPAEARYYGWDDSIEEQSPSP